jgi:hypothetical protein
MQHKSVNILLEDFNAIFLYVHILGYLLYIEYVKNTPQEIMVLEGCFFVSIVFLFFLSNCFGIK